MVLKVAVLASGGGRTLQNLIDRSRADLPISICAVGTSRKDCGAVQRAAKASVPTFVRRKKRKETTACFSKDIFEQIRAFKADYVCLAGWLHLLEIPQDFENRVLNIHPSLIPSFCGHGFYGSKVHEAVWKAGVRVTGCTVHFCDNIYDHGPIIVQRAVELDGSEDPHLIADKVFSAELEAYPEALSLIAKGALRIVDGRVMTGLE